MLEVIAMTIEDAIIAEAGGATRLELCANLVEGGTTPSYGTIKHVVQAVDIPVFVMLRPHANSFYYCEDDIAIMQDDVKIIKELGAKGVVLGGLTRENEVDHSFLKQILPLTAGLEVTFHRAFDAIENQLKAFQELLQYTEITRVLTSAGPGKAIEHLEQMKALIEASKNTKLAILPGSGINCENSEQLWALGAKELHIGSAVHFNESFSQSIDIEKVRKLIQIQIQKNFEYNRP